MKKLYIDQLSEEYHDLLNHGTIIVNILPINSSTDLNSRIISISTQQAKKLENKVSIFNVSVWPPTKHILETQSCRSSNTKQEKIPKEELQYKKYIISIDGFKY